MTQLLLYLGFFNALWLNRRTRCSRQASCKLYPWCAWSLGKWRQEDGKLQASLDYITSSSRTGWGGVEKSRSFTEKNGVLGLLSSSYSPVYLDPFLRGNHCCHGVQLFSDLSSSSSQAHTHCTLPPTPTTNFRHYLLIFSLKCGSWLSSHLLYICLPSILLIQFCHQTTAWWIFKYTPSHSH